VAGAKLRIRPESFADHYSQARQFFISQTPIEQKHLIDALVFELSKVETPRIRAKMVGHLRNIDEQMATKVARGLRIDLPPPAKAAKEPITGLPSSDPLSIIRSGPSRFEGRKLGVLMTDGAPAALYTDLKAAIEAAKGIVEVIAPQVGGAVTSDGTLVEAKQNIKGGRSVLYDAVALLVSDAGAVLLEHDAASRDFVADAFAHCKFIGYTKAAALLLERAGVTPDDGCIALEDVSSVSYFVGRLGDLRLWARELVVDAGT
jgi:catalase